MGAWSGDCLWDAVAELVPVPGRMAQGSLQLVAQGEGSVDLLVRMSRRWLVSRKKWHVAGGGETSWREGMSSDMVWVRHSRMFLL